MKMALSFKMKVPEFLKSVRYSLAAVNGVFLCYKLAEGLMVLCLYACVIGGINAVCYVTIVLMPLGLLLLIVGIVTIVTYSEYELLITQRFFTVPSFVIATGVIICLGSVLGFYGAISEQFYFIAGYVILLLVVLVFEIALVISGYSLKADAVSEIRSPMLQSLQLYETRRDIAKLWDDLQMQFECCGVAGRFDYISNRIPVSCCHIDYGTISPFECNTANAYSDGCANLLGEWLSYNASVIAVTAVVITCFQVLMTAMAGWLAWRAKFEEVELES